MELFFQKRYQKWTFIVFDLLVFILILWIIDINYYTGLTRGSVVFLGLTILLASTGSGDIDIAYFDYVLLSMRVFVRGVCFLVVYFLLVGRPSIIFLSIVSYVVWFILSCGAKCLFAKLKKPYQFLFLSRESVGEHKSGRLKCVLKKEGFEGNDIIDNDALVVDSCETFSAEQQKFVSHCKALGFPVLDLSHFEELACGRLNTEALQHQLIGNELTEAGIYKHFKPLVESSLIIVLSPILLLMCIIVALLIRVKMGKSVVFSQERYGKDGKIFRIYKFRTMVIDSEKDGAKFAQEHDPRVTPLGRFLRKFRVDELPQLWNVLKGDMSLIGPRPEQKVFVEKFTQEIPLYYLRHTVKPGITGWAQVNQGYADDETSTTLKLRYDMFYIKYFSFWLDVRIVLKTVWTMLTGFGAK